MTRQFVNSLSTPLRPVQSSCIDAIGTHLLATAESLLSFPILLLEPDFPVSIAVVPVSLLSHLVSSFSIFLFVVSRKFGAFGAVAACHRRGTEQALRTQLM
jgi:hypothetical protein